MANILCLDFDDTIVLDNTTRQIFSEFAPPKWREFDQRYHQGLMSVEQSNAASLDLIEASREEVQEFVRSVARPRQGLVELCDWAHWNGWLTVVVSNGFDLYVDPILDDLGLDRIARHTGRTRRDYRWRLTYYSPRGIELQEGFKLSYAQAYKRNGDFVAYIGDGASDIPAASIAPVVFARSTLLEQLQGTHPRLYPFETFDDVAAVLQQEAEGWLAAALQQ